MTGNRNQKRSTNRRIVKVKLKTLTCNSSDNRPQQNDIIWQCPNAFWTTNGPASTPLLLAQKNTGPQHQLHTASATYALKWSKSLCFPWHFEQQTKGPKTKLVSSSAATKKNVFGQQKLPNSQTESNSASRSSQLAMK